MLRIFGLENFHIIFLTPLLRYIDVRETSSLWLPVKPPHSQGSERACHFACAASAHLLPHRRPPRGSGPCGCPGGRRWQRRACLGPARFSQRNYFGRRQCCVYRFCILSFQNSLLSALLDGKQYFCETISLFSNFVGKSLE